MASVIIDWSINSLNNDQWLCIDSLTCLFLRVSNCHPYNMSPRLQGIVTSKHSQPILFPTALWPSIKTIKKPAVLSEKKRCAINPSTSRPIKLNNHGRGNVSTTSTPQGFPNREKGMSCQYLTKRVLMPIGHEEFRTCKPNIFDWCCLAWLFYLLKIAQRYVYVYYINSWWFTWFFHRVSNQLQLFFPNHLRASRGQVPFLVSAISWPPGDAVEFPCAKLFLRGPFVGREKLLDLFVGFQMM